MSMASPVPHPALQNSIFETMAKEAQKSRPLKRKTSHSVIERRRREKINEGLIHLQDTVPACRLELKELLECKVRSNKKNARKDERDLKVEIEEIFKDKSASEMVLEKLCIISHTVDYVHELQDKVDAYRRWCRCSPPLPDAPQSQSHDQAHIEGQLHVPLTISSTEAHKGESSECQDCASLSIGRRHWGSNHPLRLNRVDSRNGKDEKEARYGTRRSQRQAAAVATPMANATEASISPDIHNLIHCDEDESSDLELEDWHASHNHHLCASHFYSNREQSATLPSRKKRSTLDSLPSSTRLLYHPSSHDRQRTPLGVLAQVSAECQRVSPPSPT